MYHLHHFTIFLFLCFCWTLHFKQYSCQNRSRENQGKLFDIKDNILKWKPNTFGYRRSIRFRSRSANTRTRAAVPLEKSPARVGKLSRRKWYFAFFVFMRSNTVVEVRYIYTVVYKQTRTLVGCQTGHRIGTHPFPSTHTYVRTQPHLNARVEPSYSIRKMLDPGIGFCHFRSRVLRDE